MYEQFVLPEHPAKTHGRAIALINAARNDDDEGVTILSEEVFSHPLITAITFHTFLALFRQILRAMPKDQADQMMSESLMTLAQAEDKPLPPLGKD